MNHHLLTIDTQPETCQTHQVPGKLFVAGEYAILTPGQGAILIGIDQYLTAEIQASTNHMCQLHSDQLADLAIPLVEDQLQFSSSLSDQNNPWRYVQSALITGQALLKELAIEPRSFRLNLTSQLANKDGRKYGLGSSGAVTVASLKAYLNWHGITLHHPTSLFKLAAISIIRLKSQGSLADIATNCLGGWVYYQNFERDWLEEALNGPSCIPDLLQKPWPGLRLESLPHPDQISLAIGWTGAPASSDNLVERMKQKTLSDPVVYQAYLVEVQLIVQELYQAIQEQQPAAFLEAIINHRHLLQDLGTAYDLPIETEPLQQLIDLANANGWVAKSSGAGGGDCGLAFKYQGQDEDRRQLQQDWQQAGIDLLNADVCPSFERK
ncbi:phosphomevalonate kinase [Hutsoniella sourekii]|uniref:phosphomevalonate kinase n=1 Tax=Hutsoniella sourekii TaxID=87650 RepID=UPI0004B076A7|nr:phosphomevalonate kinase [Hutsoniella sourekii]